MLGNPKNVLDMENRKVYEILPYYLRDCGYKTEKSRKRGIALEIILDDKKIGELNRLGELSVDEALTVERDKIISIIEYLTAYSSKNDSFMGQRILTDFNNTILAVYLDRKTCKHRFYVYNAYQNIKSDEHMEKFGYDSLEEVKTAFINTVKKSLRKMCKELNALSTNLCQQCEIEISIKNAKPKSALLQKGGGDSE